MSISSCPQCGKQVTIPAGVATSAKVRCPLCHSQYTLADALVNMPPLLELIDEEANNEPAIPPEAAPVALAMEPETVEALEAPPEVESGEPVAEEELLDTLELDSSGGEESLTFEGEEVEIEELAVTPDEPPSSDAEADFTPLETADADEESALDFSEEPVTEEPTLESAGAEASAEDDLGLDFEEAATSGEPGEEAEIQFDDEMAPADAMETAETAETVEAIESEGDDLVFDLDEPSEGAETGGEELADLSVSDEVETEPAEFGGLDFGEPVEGEEQPVPVAAVASEEEPESEAAELEDTGKKGKKKKKKEKKPKPAKAEGGEEKPRRPLSTALSVVLGAVIAVPLALYVVLWLGSDYDFLGLGPSLHGWGVPLPASYGRSTQLAAGPITPAPPAAPQENFPQPDGAATPPALPDDTGAAANTSPDVEPPTEPAAEAPSPEMTEEPSAEPATPATDTGGELPAESPAPATPEMPAESSAEPAVEPPAEPPTAEPTPTEPAATEPATTEPVPTEPVAGEPAAAVPGTEPPGDSVDNLFPSDETPEEMPAEPADSAAPEAPVTPTDVPGESPAPETLSPEPAAPEPAAPVAPTRESPTPEAAVPDTAMPADDPFADTAIPGVPSELPNPLDEAMPEEEPAGPVGPVNRPQVSLADVTTAINAAQEANKQMGAVGPTTPQDEVKRLRSNFYLSFFRLADALTNAEDAGAAQMTTMRGQLDRYLRRFATDAKRLDALKYNAGRWLDYPKRSTPGIMMAGTVQSVEPVGRLHAVKLGIGLQSDAPIVTVLTADDPGVLAGDKAVVLGTIVDNPAENVAGYQGSDPTAVWNGMLVKLNAGS